MSPDQLLVARGTDADLAAEEEAAADPELQFSDDEAVGAFCFCCWGGCITRAAAWH